jgi:hypothetical protein
MAHPKIILLAALALLSMPMPAAAGSSTMIVSHNVTPDAARAAAASDIGLVGHAGGVVTGLAVQGSYAYTGISAELAVLDMADPAHPSRVASVALPARTLAVTVDGQHAYVLTTGTSLLSGLTIVDISQPPAPSVVANISIKANKSWRISYADLCRQCHSHRPLRLCQRLLRRPADP